MVMYELCDSLVYRKHFWAHGWTVVYNIDFIMEIEYFLIL